MARRMMSTNQLKEVADKSATSAVEGLSEKILTFDVDAVIWDMERIPDGTGAGKALRDWLQSKKYVFGYKYAYGTDVTYAILNYDNNSIANIADDATTGQEVTGTIIWGFTVSHYEVNQTAATIEYEDLTGGTWKMTFSGQPWNAGYGRWHIDELTPKAS